LVTVSDKKIGVDANSDGVIDYYNADVVTAQDYYPFGSQMPGRKFSQPNSSYRYGFNGKENDNSTGEGNLDFEARIYDARLGRFLSVDPMYRNFPHQSPFVFADNSPIALIDFKGMSGEPPTLLNVGTSLIKYVKAWDLQVSYVRLAAAALHIAYDVKANNAHMQYKKFMDKMKDKYSIGTCDDCGGGGGATGKWGEPDKKNGSDERYYKPSTPEHIIQLTMSKSDKAKAEKLLSEANEYKKTAEDLEMVFQILGKVSSKGLAQEVIKAAYKEVKKKYEHSTSKEKKKFNVDKEVGKMLKDYIIKQAQKVKDAASKSEN
jgi:RHS repeat-associated protein